MQSEGRRESRRTTASRSSRHKCDITLVWEGLGAIVHTEFNQHNFKMAVCLCCSFNVSGVCQKWCQGVIMLWFSE